MKHTEQLSMFEDGDTSAQTPAPVPAPTSLAEAEGASPTQPRRTRRKAPLAIEPGAPGPATTVSDVAPETVGAFTPIPDTAPETLPVTALPISPDGVPGLPPPSVSEAVATDPLDPAALAIKLEQHPDYRVLRRLVPTQDYGGLHGQRTCRVLLLDTETTGLNARQDRIIELALLWVQVDLQTGLPVGPVQTYESFEDPGRPIPPEVTEITGIDDRMVHGQRIEATPVQALVDASDLVLAHNAGFDRPFVEARLPVFADKAWNCSFAGIDWKAQGRGSAKLEYLAAAGGWFYDAHRALVDCHALLQVLCMPLSDGRTGLLHLIEGAHGVRFRLSATGAPFDAKDRLKARGYRWDGEQRVWQTLLQSEAQLEAEMAWLKAQAYGGRSHRVTLEAQDSRVQFSGRSGLISERTI